MSERNGKSVMEKFIMPGMIVLIGAGVAYLLNQQSALSTTVSAHHERDIDRKESMELFSTRAEIRECVKRLDEKLDLVLVSVKELRHDEQMARNGKAIE